MLGQLLPHLLDLEKALQILCSYFLFLLGFQKLVENFLKLAFQLVSLRRRDVTTILHRWICGVLSTTVGPVIGHIVVVLTLVQLH